MVSEVITEDGSNRQRLPIHETNVPRVCCAILASITTGGTTYAFGLYGDALKKTLHLSQSQLDTVSAVFFLSGLVSFIPGGFADRFGTRFGISVGGLTGAATLMLYWAVSKAYLPWLSDDPNVVVAVLSVVGVGIFLSCALVTGSVFKIISCQCGPGTKGSAVGVAKGYVGLGSGAYACLFESIRRPETSDLDFLPLCAFFFVTAATIPSFCTLPNKQEETHQLVPDVFTPLHFRLLYASLVLLATMIIGKSLEALYQDKHQSGSYEEPNYTFAFLIIVVWIGPIIAQLYLPQRSDYYVSALTRGGHDHQSDNEIDNDGETDPCNDEREHETLLQQEDSNGDGISPRSVSRKHYVKPPEQTDSGEKLKGKIPLGSLDATSSVEQGTETLPPDEIVEGLDHEDGEDDENDDEVRVISGSFSQDGDSGSHDKNLYQMMQTPTAWLMLWTGTILAGGGTVETNNLGQMCESLGFSPVVTPAAMALFSVAQSGGRVITGALSEAALSMDTQRCCIDRGIPRPFFFAAASLMGVLAHSILALATEEISFIVGITMAGAAFGMIWPLLVLCVGEFFGTEHVGANYMFYDGFVSAAGTFLLAKVVAQQVYESHIDPHSSNGGGSGSDGVTCYGQKCFQMTHVVIVVLSLTCLVTSLMVQYKTRKIYNKRNLQGGTAGGGH